MRTHAHTHVLMHTCVHMHTHTLGGWSHQRWITALHIMHSKQGPLAVNSSGNRHTLSNKMVDEVSFSRPSLKRTSLE